MKVFFLSGAAILVAASASAQELYGSWQVQTGDLSVDFRDCTLEGRLEIRAAGEPLACELTLAQQCARQKGKYLRVREPCALSLSGDKVEIKGTSYEILEAVPHNAWKTQYKLDRFRLTLSPDRQSMTGYFYGKAHTRATFTRMQDLAE